MTDFINIHNLPESPYYGFDEQYMPYPIKDVLGWLAFHDEKKDHILVAYECWHDTKGQLVEISTRFFGTTRCLWESMVFVDYSPIHELTKRRDDYGTSCLAHGYNREMARKYFPPDEEENKEEGELTND